MQAMAAPIPMPMEELVESTLRVGVLDVRVRVGVLDVRVGVVMLMDEERVLV